MLLNFLEKSVSDRNMLDQVRERTFCVLLERFSKAPTKSALAMESSHFQNESSYGHSPPAPNEENVGAIFFTYSLLVVPAITLILNQTNAVIIYFKGRVLHIVIIPDLSLLNFNTFTTYVCIIRHWEFERNQHPIE